MVIAPARPCSGRGGLEPLLTSAAKPIVYLFRHTYTPFKDHNS